MSTNARLSQVAGHLSEKYDNAAHTSPASFPRYEIVETPLGSNQSVRVITIGAGMSGINMIRTLRLHLTNFEHVVYEKNPKIGGTWYENRYPGCKCDVPSHNYQFSWRPNPEWSEFFSPAPEIEAYLETVCDEENMRGTIKTEHQVTRATWDEKSALWHIIVKDLRNSREFEDTCNFLLDGSGILNHWKWPDIAGLHSFQGKLVHSADWPQDWKYEGLAVAVIGNGSSGVQILPEMQRFSKQIFHFVREPTWIVPSRLQLLTSGHGGGIFNEIELNDDESFSQAQIERFKSDKAFYMRFVKSVEEVVNGNFPLTLKDTEFARNIQKTAVEYMTEALKGDKRLCDAMIPDFPIGCRRLTPNVSYLHALRKPNVNVVTDAIIKITPEGLETVTGEVIKVDAIVCATGFNVSFRPRFPIISRGENLQDRWSTEIPKSYMSCAVPGYPNYFTFLGPNAPIGHGSVFTITEHIAKYLVKVIRKCQLENIKSISPSQTATEELYEHTQAFMPRTAWSGNCTSWFKNGSVDGPVTALHPGSRIHFFHMLEEFRGEDWEYTRYNEQNRYAYLGNGFSTREEPGQDSTWYLNIPDKL